MLSQESLNQLRRILKKELGEYIEQFSDTQIQSLGVRLLGLTATVMKHKISIQSTNESKSDRI